MLSSSLLDFYLYTLLAFLLLETLETFFKEKIWHCSIYEPNSAALRRRKLLLDSTVKGKQWLIHLLVRNKFAPI